MSDTEDSKSEVVYAALSPIATPLANEKLTGRTLKLVRKAAKAKSVRRGVKEVLKALRKKEKGVMVIAGNVTPIDVISHLPVMCEDRSIPYIYVPAKEELGAASSTKRPTSCVLVLPKKGADWMDSYEKVEKAVSELQVEY
jgi:H/ACA ribonucleoprotein complex subunit 2